MPWLLREDDVLAALEDRRKGWQTSISGAVVIRRPALLQTLTRSSATELDVAWCLPTTLADGRLEYLVRRVSVLSAHRVALPRVRARVVVVAPRGTFERWHLQVGDRLEVRGT
jgi:hypothetical protein